MTSTAAYAAVFYFKLFQVQLIRDSLVGDCHDNTFDEYL
jgi:hypothetical protein